MRKQLFLILVIAVLTAFSGLSATAASSSSSAGGGGASASAGKRAGIIATFEVEGERFRVFVTNKATIEQIRALQRGESAANIPVGKLRRGPGPGRVNAPWHWHLDSNEIEMAEMAIEVCDGLPSYVESNYRDFRQAGGDYCPWGAQLISVKNARL